MSTITIQDLQANPIPLLNRVEAGESFLLLRDGNPVAELRPVASPRLGPRPVGLCAGVFTVPGDFDAPLPEDILREFEGR
jgi:antitoxin (DNA-binding transcriptional repressor) of toxin-antitoxin stability system